MKTVAQAFAKDTHFMKAVDTTIGDFKSLDDETMRMMLAACAEFLDMRYRQQKPIKQIAQHMHLSQKTLHRCIEKRAHEWLYHRLVRVAPDVASFFHLCYLPLEPKQERPRLIVNYGPGLSALPMRQSVSQAG